MPKKTTAPRSGLDTRNETREETQTAASTRRTRAQPTAEATSEGKGADKAPRGRPQVGKLRGFQLRLPEPMFPLIEQCISESPIEFATVADFVRRAVETELRRRGKIKTYRE